MSVKIEEFIRIQGFDGVKKEGKLVAKDLVAIEDTIEGGHAYGQPLEIVKVRTTVTCDLEGACTKGTVDGEFRNQPKTICFDDSGAGPEQFIKDVAEVTIATDYQGQRKVFCSYECCAYYFRKAGKINNVIEFPSGKGKRTFDLPTETVERLDSAGKHDPNGQPW